MDEGQSAKISPSEPDGMRFPEWKLPLQELILEFDRARLQEKMQRVEALIYDRLQQFHQCNGDDPVEREALNDAISVLRVLKREKLDFPDWK